MNEEGWFCFITFVTKGNKVFRLFTENRPTIMQELLEPELKNFLIDSGRILLIGTPLQQQSDAELLEIMTRIQMLY